MVRAQSLEEALEKMGRYSMLPKTSQAEHEAGVFTIAPPKYMKREVVKGALAPVGRFRGPLPTRTNASTLHLFGPGLSSFAAWQVGAHWNAFYLVSWAWTGVGTKATAICGLARLPQCLHAAPVWSMDLLADLLGGAICCPPLEGQSEITRCSVLGTRMNGGTRQIHALWMYIFVNW